MISIEEINKMRRTKPTPAKVRRELERLGISQAAGADLLEINHRTMRRYLQEPGSVGSLTMPFASFALLRIINKEAAGNGKQ